MTFRHIIGWFLVVLTLIAVIGSAIIFFNVCWTDFPHPNKSFQTLGLSFSGLIFMLVGRLLTLYRPENPIGWLLAIVGFALPLSTGLDDYAQCALSTAGSLPHASLSAWVVMIGSTIVILALFMLLPALFPTGNFTSKPWKLVVGSIAAGYLLLIFLAAIAPGPMSFNATQGKMPLDNPFGLPLPWLRSLENFIFYGIAYFSILGSLVGIAAFIARFRRSSGDERQQLKWFAYFLVTVVAVHLVGFELIGSLIYPDIFDHWSYGLILILSFSGFPLVIGLAIFKYRLYDIDLIIRKTLVYGLLTAALALVFFGLITMLQSLFSAVSNQQSPLSIVLSTLAIAALFNPLRSRLQDFIDRRFYRQKYDAEKALAEFAAAVRAETDLDALSKQVVGIVEKTLQPAELSMWMKRETIRHSTSLTQDIGGSDEKSQR